jgi:glycerol-3-phosphate dehydrogenase
MNQQRAANHHSNSHTGAMLSRQDKATAAIVKKGVTLQQIHGTEYAAEFLREKNIDMDIVMRVLHKTSGRHRQDDLPDVLHPAQSDDLF